MPKFSANISTLFREYPAIERIGKAAAAGFDAIEIQFPYAEDPLRLRDALDEAGMPLVLMNFPAGDLMQGGEGLAAIPGRESEFDEALVQARRYAEILRPAAMNLLSGRPSAGRARDTCRAVFESSLRRAYGLTRDLGIKLLTEPVNSVDLPGFFLDGSQQALDLIASMPDVGLGLQYDLYHMQIMEADIESRLPEIIGHIGHIQFSDVPGRTEPGLGCIDFPRIFELIDRLGYDAYVGAEYFPTVHTDDTLEWLAACRRT